MNTLMNDDPRKTPKGEAKAVGVTADPEEVPIGELPASTSESADTAVGFKTEKIDRQPALDWNPNETPAERVRRFDEKIKRLQERSIENRYKGEEDGSILKDLQAGDTIAVDFNPSDRSLEELVKEQKASFKDSPDAKPLTDHAIAVGAIAGWITQVKNELPVKRQDELRWSEGSFRSPKGTMIDAITIGVPDTVGQEAIEKFATKFYESSLFKLVKEPTRSGAKVQIGHVHAKGDDIGFYRITLAQPDSRADKGLLALREALCAPAVNVRQSRQSLLKPYAKPATHIERAQRDEPSEMRL